MRNLLRSTALAAIVVSTVAMAQEPPGNQPLGNANEAAQERLQHCIEESFLVVIHVFDSNTCTRRGRRRYKMPVKAGGFCKRKNSVCFLPGTKRIQKSNGISRGGPIDLFILGKNGKR